MTLRTMLMGILYLVWLPVAQSAAQKPVLMGQAQAAHSISVKVHQGIGVNYYNAFVKVLREPEDRSYKSGLNQLAQRKIPFIRFVLTGFFPSDMSLYQKDKAKFYALLDEFVAEAEKNEIGLMPSLFFAYWQVPDLVREPMQAWGDPDSRTHTFMRHFTTEVVTRYRNSPSIWGWEFSNETSYFIDLDEKARPRLAPLRGTPRFRTERDDLRNTDMTVAKEAFATLVNNLDPGKMISAGDALPRADAYQTSYRTGERNDTRQEFFEILKRDNPDSFNLLSLHLYPHTRYFRGERNGLDTQKLVELVQTMAVTRKQIVFVGEFGVPTREGVPEIEERRKFKEILDGIVNAGVHLAAIWDFDPDVTFDKEWNIATPRRLYQLDAVVEANRRFAK